MSNPETKTTVGSGGDASADNTVRWGSASAVLAHCMWGFFPLYWELVAYILPVALTAYRIVWSFVWLVMFACVWPKSRKLILSQLRSPKNLLVYAAAALMIGTNWTSFMLAVGNDQVLQASLGYYINPLLNVLMGVTILGERLRPFQWIAVGLAAIGVAVMATNGLPIYALSMAVSFATYSLIKKKASLPPLEGLTLETAFLFPIAMAYLLCMPTLSTGEYTTTTWFFLFLGGLVTVSPLAFFAYAARRIPLSTMGILQYIGPTLQFLVGVVILNEDFDLVRKIGFGFVWAGVLVFMGGSLWATRRTRPKPSNTR